MNGLTDFTDWLSPMLVKELRQGVRSRIFVVTLLLLQTSLMLLAIGGLLASDAQQNTEVVSAFFWLLAGAFLILFLPLSGLKAIAHERTSNTLELIFLTRLSARRIVAGKWLAIVAQTTLLVFTILPYIVLRYFLGGVDLWRELLTVAEMLVGSAVLSAITVGFSPLPSVLSRIAIASGLILGLFLLQFTLPMISMSVGRGPMRGASLSSVWKDYAAAGVGTAFIIVFMLEFGAARIAPPAENHSSPLRLIGLCAIAAGITADHAFFRSAGPGTLMAFCFTLPILIGALCESPRMIANIYRPFVRRGFLGKAAGRFLYPGWPSATPYALLVLSALGLELYFKSSARDRGELLLFSVIVAGSLLLPAAIIRFFGKRVRYPLATYIGVQAIFALLHAFASVLADIKGRDHRSVFDVIPTCALLDMRSGDSHDQVRTMLPIIGTVTALSVIALLWLSWRPWREIQVLEKKVELMKDNPSGSAPSEAAASQAVS